MFVSASPTGPESTAYLRPAMEGEVKITYPILSKIIWCFSNRRIKIKNWTWCYKRFLTTNNKRY